jgi:hypothetical protein
MAPSHLIPHNPELSTSLSVFFFHDSFILLLLWQMAVDGGFINLKAFTERSRSPLHPITLSSITTILNYDKCFLAQLRDKSGEGKVFVCCSFVFVFASVMFSALPPATEANRTNSRSNSMKKKKTLMDFQFVYNATCFLLASFCGGIRIFTLIFPLRMSTNSDLLKTVTRRGCCERQVKVFSFLVNFRGN